MKKIFFLILPFLIMIIAALYMLEEELHAATYNFTFNNTEQGDNSTATPTVTIQDPKTGEVKTIKPAETNSTKTIEPESAPSGTKSEPRYFKLGLEYLPDYNRESHSLVGLFSVLPIRDVNFAVNFLVGQTFGAELEYRPWTGRFELGLLAGVLDYSGGSSSPTVTTYGYTPQGTTDSTSKTFGGYPRVNGGISATFNILPELSASFIVRSILPQEEYTSTAITGQPSKPYKNWWTNESFSVAYRF